ncbi:hypothetical protein IU459_26170 [Nocardia amamiensis]|uniref:Major facilitator superfamily (MFS) profile domain-containing protein n=1 Tax=Nocardia amamiensis TaxID=404578 RepID=A0ABS0CWZ9_9NOCA|nr:hypothetical protein [Nocardia amamiensis]MBF6301005.1 hypothetical protein [Nocardia amamiensis]
MIVYFIGGSSGAAFGAAAVGWFGWPATAALTAAAIAIAMAVILTTSRTRPDLRAARAPLLPPVSDGPVRRQHRDPCRTDGGSGIRRRPKS